MPFRFQLHHIAEALEEPPPIEFIVEPLFSAGSVNLVFGPGGAKKTYSMLDCLVCASLGIDWIGFKVKRAIPCLVVDEENGLYRLRRRLHEIIAYRGANGNTPLNFTTMCMIDLLRNGKDMADMHAIVVETGAKLILMDSFIDFIPGGDENSSRDVQPVFHGLRAIADKERCAFIILDHSGKDISRGARGASAKRAAVDLALLVESGKKSNRVTFKTDKTRDIEPVDFVALAIWDKKTFHMAEADAGQEKEQLSSSQALVIRSLISDGEMTTNEIKRRGAEAKFAAGTIANAIRKLAEDGKIERVDGGTEKSLATYSVVTSRRGVTFLRGPRARIEE